MSGGAGSAAGAAGGVLNGTCTPAFEGVRTLLGHNLESGTELGASLCVMRGEEVLVDLWGGTADHTDGRPWTRDTVVNTYSLTKTATALCALLLIDRGLLDPDAPVADYWPEFAANGKEQVLVRHVLGHTSGVSGWDERISIDDLYNPVASADRLAKQKPWWPPGEGSGYHAMSFGTLVGELIRRVTGSSLGEFFAAEIAGPVGADYWIGAPEHLLAQNDRIATLVPPPPTGFDYGTLPADSILRRTLTNPAFSPALTTDPRFLAAEIGAANGQGNARSVARVQSVLTCGGTVGGRRFLAPETIERIFQVQADGVDRVLGAPLRFGLGWALPSPGAMPAVPEGRVCWWTGYGGSVVVADLDRQLTITYVMNKMAPQLVGAPNATAYLHAVYAALETAA